MTSPPEPESDGLPAATGRVRRPPGLPLLLWDGDCGFCKFWKKRWEARARRPVDTQPYQAVRGRFPEIAEDDLAEALHLVLPDGRVFAGAPAVFAFEAVSGQPMGQCWCGLYQKLPGFAPVTDWAYRRVAHNRMLFSRLTRWTMGVDPEPASWRWAGWAFCRVFGLVAMIAFVSLWLQVIGLAGETGIRPVAHWQQAVTEQTPAWWQVPSFLRIHASDTALHFLCGAGAGLSLLLMAGLAPALAALGTGIVYLSLIHAIQPFLGFQWDILLVETAWCAVFFLPWRLTTGVRPSAFPRPGRLGRLLLLWLLFRLMFESGAVKLQSFSGIDLNAWRDGTALGFHYWTQPLPHIGSVWFNRLPHALDQVSLWVMWLVELVLPCLLIAPRRLRNGAVAGLAGFQLLIMASGNYGFFNLLALALCLIVIDDQSIPKRWIRRGPATPREPARPWLMPPRRVLAVAYALVAFGIGGLQVLASWQDSRSRPGPIDRLREHVPGLGPVEDFSRALSLVNPYGLFRVMTLTRPEILIEGSADREAWQPVVFRFKPSGPDDIPPVCIPHMPRLDWQLWFEALALERGARPSPWFQQFLQGLFQDRPAVSALVADNPFADSDIRWFRIRLMRYRFPSKEDTLPPGQTWVSEPVRGRRWQGQLGADFGR
ncbi:MAG: lipase maturation factor family protein [Opitutales bacterium]